MFLKEFEPFSFGYGHYGLVLSAPGRNYSCANLEIDALLKQTATDDIVVSFLKIIQQRLTRIPSFAFTFTDMTSIVLYNNQIEKFPESFSQLPHLTKLDLDGNRISFLPAGSIRSLRRLAVLSICHNLLISIPPTMRILPELRSFYICGNPVYNSEFKGMVTCTQYLSFIKKRFTHGGAQSAALTVILICKHIPAQFRNVFRHVLAPMIWASRDDEEWREADEAAYLRRKAI